MKRINDLIPISFIITGVIIAYLSSMNTAYSDPPTNITFCLISFAVGFFIAAVKGKGSRRTATQVALGTAALMLLYTELVMLLLKDAEYETQIYTCYALCLASTLNMVFTIWSSTNTRTNVYRINWLVSSALIILIMVADVDWIIEITRENIQDVAETSLRLIAVLVTALVTLFVNLTMARPGHVADYDPEKDPSLTRITPWAPLLLLVGAVMVILIYNGEDTFYQMPPQYYSGYLVLSVMMILTFIVTWILKRKGRLDRRRTLNVLIIALSLLWIYDCYTKTDGDYFLMFSTYNLFLYISFIIDFDVITWIGIILASAILIVSAFNLVKHESKWYGASSLALASLLAITVAIPMMTGSCFNELICAMEEGGENGTIHTILTFIIFNIAMFSLILNIIPRPDIMKKEEKPTEVAPPPMVQEKKEEDAEEKTEEKTVEIPVSDATVADRAFYNCKSLKVGIIPEGVTTIGDSAFFGCSEMTSVSIPNTVRTIGNNAFFGCTKLTKVTIPESVTVIGDNAFFGCVALTIISIPKGINIGANAFNGCTSLKVIDNEVVIEKPIEEPEEEPIEEKEPIEETEGDGDDWFDKIIQDTYQGDDEDETEPVKDVESKEKKGLFGFLKKKEDDGAEKKTEAPVEEKTSKRPAPAVKKEEKIEGYDYSDIYGKTVPYVSDVKASSERRCPNCKTNIGMFDKGCTRCPYCGERLSSNDLDKKKTEE